MKPKTKEEQAEAREKAAYIMDRETGEIEDSVPPALVRTAMAAWSLVQRIDELEAELKAHKDELARALVGRSLVVAGMCRVSVAETQSVSITDAEKMRLILGARFGDLVQESVSYKPTETLLAMAADGDDPMAPAYQALMRVKKSTTVRITAER